MITAASNVCPHKNQKLICKREFTDGLSYLSETSRWSTEEIYGFLVFVERAM